MYDKKLAREEERAVIKRERKLIGLTDIIRVKMRQDTSHECECCGKARCGKEAALVAIKTGEDKIICASCVEELRYTYKPSI